METIQLEIRDAEGGQDSKMLVQEMSNIYSKFCNKMAFECRCIEMRDGFVKL